MLIPWHFPKIEDNITNLKTALTVTKPGCSPQLCHWNQPWPQESYLTSFHSTSWQCTAGLPSRVLGGLVLDQRGLAIKYFAWCTQILLKNWYNFLFALSRFVHKSLCYKLLVLFSFLSFFSLNLYKINLSDIAFSGNRIRNFHGNC